MRWPKYWSFSFSIIPSKEIPGLISFRMDWLDLLAVQGTLESLLVIFGNAESSLLLVGYSVIKVLQFLSAVASLVVEHRLQGTWASVAAAHRLSCLTACGILPDQESNLCSLQADS